MIKKKIICFTLSVMLVLGIVIPVTGLGFENVFYTNGLLDVSIQSNFTTGRPASGDWGTLKGLVIRQCHVQIVQGSYNSGKQYLISSVSSVPEQHKHKRFIAVHLKRLGGYGH